MMEIRSQHACFGGTQGFYTHPSECTGSAMNFSVFLPPQAKNGPVPALYYLAGLTCTEETFMIKAGAQRLAAELGLMLVTCDTSPRDLNLPGEDEDWDFGSGAGFYLDATQAPWSDHYRMGSYVSQELPALIEANFPASDKRGIFGHSMGGHGALVTALRNPGQWHSLSAFAPICYPSNCPWGQKAFANYLGEDQAQWQAWDATILMQQQSLPFEILIDQGLGDQFLEQQLYPEALENAALQSGQQLTLRCHPEYDHGYYFIQTFMEDHLQHHARILNT